MATAGSVTKWFGPLQDGDPAAAQKLWEFFFQRMVGLARKKLQGSARRAADEEDVALSAFDSFCRHADQGRMPQLQDRDSLWRLLMVITVRKAAHLRRDASRQKRGGDAAISPQGLEAGLEGPLSREPSPQFAAQITEEYQRLLHILSDNELQAIAVCKMESYTIAEIAVKFGYAPRSIKRKLQLIRSLRESEVPT